MKRILPLILTVLLLPALLAVPARADELNIDFINVLNYTTPNMSGENTVTVSPQDKIVSFELPFHADIRYLEFTFSFSGEFFTPTVYLQSTRTTNGIVGTIREQMQIVYMGNNVFKCYGTFYYDDVTFFSLEFANFPDRRYLTFYDVSYAPEAVYPTNIVADGAIHDIGNLMYEYYLYHKKNGDSNIPEWLSNSQNTSFIAEFDVYDWQGFDYVDIVCSSYCREITSIAVTHGLGTLPFTANVISDGDSYGLYIITLRIDLTGVHLDSLNDPLVEITGLGEAGQYCNFNIRYCSGFNLIEAPNLFVFWGNKIINSIGSMGGSIIGSISSGVTSLRTGLNGIVSSIGEWGQKIVDAIAGSGDSSQLQQELDSAVNDLHQAGAALDSVQRPDLGKVNINVVGMIDPGGLSGLAAITSIFTGNSLIYTVMLMFVTLALISFILFGKR